MAPKHASHDADDDLAGAGPCCDGWGCFVVVGRRGNCVIGPGQNDMRAQVLHSITHRG